MTTKQKNILFLSITGVILLILFLFVILSSRIPMNDEFTIGNTPGNLNNGGYFCEMDGRVYFANAYDNNTLYSMNADGTDIRKLNNSPVSSINAAGKYLYYAMTSGSKKSGGDGLGYMMQTSGIYRSNLKGKSAWERAEALISIAHPNFRDELIAEAEKLKIWRKSNK